MPFSPRIVSLNEPKNQKKRSFLSNKLPEFDFGTGAIVLLNEGKMFGFHLFLLKKLVKTFKKKNYNAFKLLTRVLSNYHFSKKFKHKEHHKRSYVSVKKSFLFYINVNWPLTKKSKNSRMGKGKGLFYKWSFRTKKLHKLMEFRNISVIRINKLFSVIEKKFPYKVKIYFQKDKYISRRLVFNKNIVWTKQYKTFKSYEQNFNE